MCPPAFSVCWLTLIPKCAASFLREARKWTPIITGISYWTRSLLSRRRLVFYSSRTRNFRVCCTVWEPVRLPGITPPLGIVFHSTLLSSRALTFSCPLYVISKVSCSFALRLALGCRSARSGLLKLSFTRREVLLTKILFEVLEHHLCKSGTVVYV